MVVRQVPAVPERKPHATMDDPFSDGATPNSSLVPAHKSPATFVSNFWAILTSGSERGRKRKIIDHDAVPPSPPLPVLQIPPRPREKVKTGNLRSTRAPSPPTPHRRLTASYPTEASTFKSNMVSHSPSQRLAAGAVRGLRTSFFLPPSLHSWLPPSSAGPASLRLPTLYSHGPQPQTPRSVHHSKSLMPSIFRPAALLPKIIWIRRKRGVLAQRTDRHRHGLDLPFYLARVVFGIFPPIGPKSGTI
ncbi:hypothetical protein B0H17DRAFT_1129279 [Mycena rosella]|uniref:Uncharacterized protein n=1 Tax=Mycena rosella TaxID=1033263 RepID=A0AAD7GPI4_MYCRO|nr:hypothetical protein B0H17DRAFT_1129279 [Mycena rosella]